MAEEVGGSARGGWLSALDRRYRKIVVCAEEPIGQIKLAITNDPGADATF